MAITGMALAGILIEMYLYGINTLLFALTLHTLFQKIRKNRTNQCLALAMIVMYLVATVSALLDAFAIGSLATTLDITEARLIRLATLDNIAESLPYMNAIIGDAIVIWRAWVIWGRSWRAAIGPIILLLSSLAVVLVQLILQNRPGYLIPAAEGLVSTTTIYRLSVASYALTLSTNAVTTAMIAYRTWLHYRSSLTVRIRIGRNRALAVLLLLVESGAIYCTIWIGAIVVVTLTYNTDGGTYGMLIGLLPQLITMYPVVIVVLCALQRSYTDTATLDKPSDILPTAYRTPDTPGSRIQHSSSATAIAFATTRNGRLQRMAASTSPVSLGLDANDVDPEKTLPPLPVTYMSE
ncbi:hypothetical protein FA95DRAFT_471060 [Auriscalpium vulgare]|uniref:Uncharacterized protein n=1 Tax=Auriscalpium vulgare TaxID=40419 RepID=A0ACB8SAW3_9AGAM|nr:hypothetical protein FA95DRAFT_471060 [Auriscalpium vulgare]